MRREIVIDVSEYDELKARVAELEADVAAAKSKLWSTQDCHPNAIGTLAWDAYEILERNSPFITTVKPRQGEE